MVLPQQSQTYNPSQYEDICTGTYVTRTTTAGTVRGVLVREPGGGAAPDTLPHPMAGTVLIEFNYLNALKAIIVTDGANGRFSGSVPPGT
ncbi:MAG: hypothetical protein ABSA14_13725 [Acidimicrobiales bacterium]